MKKMEIRQVLFGAGLMGLVGVQEVQAADTTTKYPQTLGEVTEQLEDKALQLTDSNFKKEILDYDGAALILFSSNCPQTDNAANLNRNMGLVYLQLIYTFDDTKVNALPLKFAYFDGCKYNGNNAKTIIGLGVKDIETHMYLDGREIDRMKGGPTDEAGIDSTFSNMSGGWVPFNLISPKKDFTYLFEGQYQLHKVSR